MIDLMDMNKIHKEKNKNQHFECHKKVQDLSYPIALMLLKITDSTHGSTIIFFMFMDLQKAEELY